MGAIFLLQSLFHTMAWAQSQCGQLGACYMCSPGFYSNCSGDNCAQGACLNATTGCAPCAPGSFASLCAQNECASCEEGKVAPAASNSCMLCTAGTFANVSECSPCPYGSWSNGPTTQCTACGSGKFNDKMSATSESFCIPCPPGYYCPSPLTQYPFICPGNYYCEGNSIQPTACRFLFVSQSCSVVSDLHN